MFCATGVLKRFQEVQIFDTTAKTTKKSPQIFMVKFGEFVCVNILLRFFFVGFIYKNNT